MTEAEKEAEKLVKLIHDARSAAVDAKEHGERRFGQVDQAIADLRAAQERLAQAQDAANRAAYDRSIPANDRELGYYTPEKREIDGPARACYATARTGDHAVRLLGHDKFVQPNNPASKVRVWGLFDDPTPRSQWQREAQRLLDRRNFVQRSMGIKAGDPEGRRAWQCEADLLDHLRSGPDQVARIFSDTSASGAEWLPDVPMPELERELLHRPSMWQIFRQINMTRNPMVKPNISGTVTAFKGQIPNANDPAGDPLLTEFATGSHTVVAEEVSAGTQVHRNAEEDSIIGVMDEMRMQLVDATLFAIEHAIINGDSASTHQDTIASWNVRGRVGTPRGGSTSQLRLWLGLRARAYDLTSMTTDSSGNAITEANLLSDRALLNPISLMNSEGRVQVVEIVSPETFFGTLISLDEFDAFDNVGLLASVITGQLGNVSATPGGVLPGQVGFTHGRFPLLVSYCLTKDLAATGLFTASGALTGKLTVDTSRFQFYIRRGSLVEMADDIRNNTRTVISRMRCKFEAQDATITSTIKDVHWRFNTI